MLQSFFNPDNAVWSFINKIIDLVILSMFFTLCCLPIVTIGPACSALYYTVVKCIRRHRSYSAKEFFSAFRVNLQKGIIIHLILLAFTVMMFVSDVPLILTFINTGKVGDTVLVILMLLKAIILLGMICWIYPVLSRFEQGVLKIWESALVLLVRYFPVTILCIAILLCAVLLTWVEPLLLAFVPGLSALLISFPIEPVLRRICDTDEVNAESMDAWYLEK